MPLFPRRFPYLVLAAIVVLDAAWLLLAGISVTVDITAIQFLFLGAVAVNVLIVALVCHRQPQPWPRVRRFGLVLQGVLFIRVAWPALGVFGYLAMSTAYPLADATLARWDASLGFDWRGYFELVAANPPLPELLRHSYNAFVHVAVIGFLVLALTGHPRRAEFLIEAFFLTAVTCIALGMFFPANGATYHFLRDTVPEAALPGLPGLYHLEALGRLREGPLEVLDLRTLKGLVTFPSFHVAGGIVIAAAFFRTRWFWAVAGYTAVMVAATPVYGAHYVIDLLAGAPVAAAVLYALASTHHYRGVLGGAPARAGVLPADAA